MPSRPSSPSDSGRAAARPAQGTGRQSAGGARIRVLCVDDHAILVEGLKAQFAINGSIECVGHLESADNLLEAVESHQPHVIMLDIEMPGADVFESADRLRQRHPDSRFVFLSAHVRDGYLSAAYKCGAWGYFAKGDDLSDIVTGVQEVARSPHGVFVLGPKVRQRLRPAGTAGSTAHQKIPTDAPLAPRTALDSLTARELEVLRLIGKGRSRTEIAEELSRSPKTVDGHQERMMKKLKITTRAELMRFAIREGLVEA